MPTTRELALGRQRTMQQVIDTSKAWATEHELSPWTRMRRVVLLALSPSYGVDPMSNLLVVDAVVRTWLDKLAVTADRQYQGWDLDPIAADALRVLEVELTEATAAEFGTDAVAATNAVVGGWAPDYYLRNLPPAEQVLGRDAEGSEFWIPVPEPAPGPRGDPGPEGPQGMQGPPGPTSGGATTSRGTVWLLDLEGESLADKLRTAWAAGDRRALVTPHSGVLDPGSNPIPITAGCCLLGPAGPQTEFSDQGRLYVRATGGSAVFRSVTPGAKYSGTKGWSLANIGFEGTPGLRLFAPNPMNASGGLMAYTFIDGCSFDTFYTVVESPMLGAIWDVRFFNNIYGPCGWMFGGSDNRLRFNFGDWGGGNTDPKRRALMVFQSCQKTKVYGLYLTGQPATCLEIGGGSDGLEFFGSTLEGRNAGQECAGALVRMTAGSATFHGGDYNYAMANPAATGRDDRGFVDVSGGRLRMLAPSFKRGNSASSQGAPLVVQRGSGRVDVLLGDDLTKGSAVAVARI